MIARLPRRTILIGDAEHMLLSFPSASIDTVITSPPYFLLRNYGAAGQIGAEPTVEHWVDRLAGVTEQLARVLKPSGSLWLNLGDSYSRHPRYGAPAKSLLLAPERVLLRLLEQGWVVRNKAVWAKPNPMPASVRDRLTPSWEPIYFLVRSSRYFFDLNAIREPHRSQRKPQRHPRGREKYSGRRPVWAGPLAGANDGLVRAHAAGRVGHPFGKNPGDVLTIGTARYRGAHFATFPTALLTRPILATCPERTCMHCGRPWQQSDGRWRADCDCGVEWQPGVVLDPFFGAGSTAIEAERLGRDWVGIELNAAYRELALERISSAREKQEEVMHNDKERSNA